MTIAIPPIVVFTHSYSKRPGIDKVVLSAAKTLLLTSREVPGIGMPEWL
jgi:hypothetical protein